MSSQLALGGSVSVSLFLPVYLCLIPLILLAGIGMAIKRRHHLGVRASNHLAIGAGLLLLVQAFPLTRPLLRNVIAEQGDRLFASVADLGFAMSFLQLVLQAVGLGLLIAAVFAPRPAATATGPSVAPNAGADTSVGSADVHRRPVSATWKTIGLMAAVVVVAVTVTWVWQSAQANDVPPWRVSEEKAAARCLDNYAELSLPVKAKPVERFLLRKDGGWLRVHVSEPDNWINACEGGPNGMKQSFGALMGQGPPDKLRFFGGYDSVLKARLLLGHMPTGATSIEARLISGQTVRGDHDDDIFVIWAPGISVEGAQVTATGSDGVIIATATVPTHTN